MNSTTITPAFLKLLADPLTNIAAFNQSRFFQKNASGLKEAQIEINGAPVYPFPQPPHLIKNNNLDAFDLEGDNYCGDYPGLQSLEQWTNFRPNTGSCKLSALNIGTRGKIALLPDIPTRPAIF